MPTDASRPGRPCLAAERGRAGEAGSIPVRLPEDRDRLAAHAGWRAGNILDVRAAGAFHAGHLAGAVNLPIEEGLRRARGSGNAELAAGLPSIFLPPREEALVVVAETGEVGERVCAHLHGRGRTGVLPVVWPGGGLADIPEPWRECGTSRGHLWRPPPFLARWAHLLPPPAAGPVLDLACGSGRSSVWLARRGYRVTGVDWQPEALSLAHRLALHAGVEVDLTLGDLRRREGLPAGPWSVALAFRFLHRPLVLRLPEILQPGGTVIMRTFRHAPGYVGNPRPRHRLARGELTRLFPPPDFAMLVHCEDFDPDGVPAAGAVALYGESADEQELGREPQIRARED